MKKLSGAERQTGLGSSILSSWALWAMWALWCLNHARFFVVFCCIYCNVNKRTKQLNGNAIKRTTKFLIFEDCYFPLFPWLWNSMPAKFKWSVVRCCTVGECFSPLLLAVSNSPEEYLISYTGWATTGIKTPTLSCNSWCRNQAPKSGNLFFSRELCG